MQYNTTRGKLLLPEYGRNVQNMIRHAMEIEDREERQRAAQAIIEVMGQLNPHLRDVDDFRHKLWTHLFIMSDFKLDVDSPYEIPKKEMLDEKPNSMEYPKSKIRYGHYGQYTQKILESAKDIESEEEKAYMTSQMGNFMKRQFLSHNNSAVENNVIAEQLNELSQGTLKIDNPDELITTKQMLKTITPQNNNRRGGSNNNRKKKSQKRQGTNYTMSSACATSGHCIGNSMELIQMGKQDVVFAGGSEEVHWAMTAMFDAMTALSSKYNDAPETASRAYDKTRDGFVIAGGAGVLVLEEYEHAKARGAKIYAELTGYGATSDGYDMVAPSGEGAVRCMQMAMSTAKNKIDYINTHGTSTPVGDITELNAVKNTFGDNIPKISSTKSLSGHPLGAASVHEAIYCLIMMKNNFIAGSANISEMDEEAKKFPIVSKTETGATLNTVMSNSFGFGGTNAALIFEKV